MSKKSQIDSLHYLQKMGIEILTNTFVVSYDGELLKTNNGKTIKTKTVIWSAGISANTIQGIPKTSVGQGQRLLVDQTNALEYTEAVYVLGDMALMKTPKYPNGHPQLANVAINQAKNLAKNLKRKEQGLELKKYEYTDLGTMATVGRNKSVVDLPTVHLKGFFAWAIWMFLHLMLILSVKNKLIIFINWAWAYITKNSALRIIIKEH